MAWLALLPAVIQLIGLAEKLFAKDGQTGPIKKSIVMSTAQSIVGGMAAVSTGGQKETWTNMAPAVSTFIDSTVAIANTCGWDGIVNDNFEAMKNGQ